MRCQVALAAIAALSSANDPWVYEETDASYTGTVQYNRGSYEI